VIRAPAPAPVLWTLGGVFVMLAVASVAARLVGRRRPGAESQSLLSRVRTWWVMVAVFSAALLFNRAVSLVFFAFLSFLAFKEYLSLIPTRRADRRVLFWAYLAIPLQYVWIGREWYGMFVIWIPVYVFLFLPLRMILVGETAGFLRSAGTIHWGLMTTVFTLSHIAYLMVLPAGEQASGGGAGLVLYLVLLTQANDVAQYVWGKSLGRRKVIPRVSPNKTVAGLAGGVATTAVLAALLGPWLTPLSRERALFVGLLVGLCGFVGDVVISALKRDLAIKDSGTMLPGHGGILDRIDSLTYTAPLFFHFMRYVYY